MSSYLLAALPDHTAVYVLKAISVMAVLAIAVLVSRLAARRGTEPLAAAAFVALNPLVLAPFSSRPGSPCESHVKGEPAETPLLIDRR